MSANCIQCVKNPRTGPDLLCDECRAPSSFAAPNVRHPSEWKSVWNRRYQMAVCNAVLELYDMPNPKFEWEERAAVIVTKHLTPLFRDLRDDAKRMDWLDAHGPAIHLKGPMQGVASANPGHLRECIDAAMREDA